RLVLVMAEPAGAACVRRRLVVLRPRERLQGAAPGHSLSGIFRLHASRSQIAALDLLIRQTVNKARWAPAANSCAPHTHTCLRRMRSSRLCTVWSLASEVCRAGR